MVLQDIINFIAQPLFPDNQDDPALAKYKHSSGYFNVYYKDLDKPLQKRLFLTAACELAEATKFKKTNFKGPYISDYDKWDKIELISWDIRENLKDFNKIFKHNLKNAIKYLNSGFDLNPALLAKFKEVFKFSNDFNNNREEIEKILGTDLAWSLASRSIETSNFGKGWTEIIRNELRNAIKGNYRYSSGRFHTMGRDVSINFEPDHTKDGYNCWYQREYTNCGNGDYYLALDDTHVLFIERD